MGTLMRPAAAYILRWDAHAWPLHRPQGANQRGKDDQPQRIYAHEPQEMDTRGAC